MGIPRPSNTATDNERCQQQGREQQPEDARVMCEKFDVIQNVVEACDQVRKVESQSNAGKRDLLTRKRRMWLKNWVNLTAKEAHNWDSMGPRTVCDLHSLQDEAGAFRCLPV
jgi:hypothetical protein